MGGYKRKKLMYQDKVCGGGRTVFDLGRQMARHRSTAAHHAARWCTPPTPSFCAF